MARPALEVADVFRDHGAAWRHANRGHVSLLQLKVMSAIESCRTAALGGHVARCEDCAHTTMAYNSCRNRHCPKCQGAAARQWMAAREAELLPITPSTLSASYIGFVVGCAGGRSYAVAIRDRESTSSAFTNSGDSVGSTAVRA